jgi:hypothetical protein
MACNDLEVKDKLECKMKVKEFIAESRKLEEKEREKKASPVQSMPSLGNDDKIFGG